MTRVRWQPLLKRAAEIIEAEPYGMTLRGLFYRLVSEELLPNTKGYYSSLSSYSAQARREGWFPDLIDPTRRVRRPVAFESPKTALDWLADIYRRDRLAGQPCVVYVGVEKNALAGPIEQWFEAWGVPVLALGGYASQTFANTVADELVHASAIERRETVLIYAGDLDPSGEDIDRDFIKRVGGFDVVERVALTFEQVDAYNLPPQMGKAYDSRAAEFIRRHGVLVQVELDALPLVTLRDLLTTAVTRYLDVSEIEAQEDAEERERARLAAVELPPER